jgi:hypothetical protein
MDDLDEQPLPHGSTMIVTEVAMIAAAAVILGDTPKAIRRRIEDKVWVEGREYHRRGGRVWIDLKGVAAWVRGDAEAA